MISKQVKEASKILLYHSQLKHTDHFGWLVIVPGNCASVLELFHHQELLANIVSVNKIIKLFRLGIKKMVTSTA